MPRVDTFRKSAHLHQTVRQVLDDSLVEQKLPLLNQVWCSNLLSAYSRQIGLALTTEEALGLISTGKLANTETATQAVLLRFSEFYKRLFYMSQQHYALDDKLLKSIQDAIDSQGLESYSAFMGFLGSPTLPEASININEEFLRQEDELLASNAKDGQLDTNEVLQLLGNSIERDENALIQVIELFLASLESNSKAKHHGFFVRVLLNFLLVSRSYPPIWIESSEQSAYLDYLKAFKNGDCDLLRFFILNKIHHSLELTAKALQSPYVIPDSSVDPQVNRFIRGRIKESTPDTALSIAILKRLVSTTILQAFKLFYFKMDQFTELFVERKTEIFISIGGINTTTNIIHPDQLKDVILKNLEEGTGVVEMVVKLLAYKSPRGGIVNVNKRISFHLKNNHFALELDHSGTKIEKSYSEPLSLNEIKDFISETPQSVMAHLETSDNSRF